LMVTHFRIDNGEEIVEILLIAHFL